MFMKGLVLDTTVKRAYVAAFDGAKESVYYFDESLSTQSELIPACEAVLSEVGMTPSDLDGVAAVVGPGSFTGIRIGVAFANALAYALSVPRFSLTSFEVMRVARPDAPCYMIDAGHDSAYAARIVVGSLVQENLEKKDLPIGTVDQNDILDLLPASALVATRKAFEERAYSACVVTKECIYLKPNYMRKSQAERMKDNRA